MKLRCELFCGGRTEGDGGSATGKDDFDVAHWVPLNVSENGIFVLHSKVRFLRKVFFRAAECVVAGFWPSGSR